MSATRDRRVIGCYRTPSAVQAMPIAMWALAPGGAGGLGHDHAKLKRIGGRSHAVHESRGLFQPGRFFEPGTGMGGRSGATRTSSGRASSPFDCTPIARRGPAAHRAAATPRYGSASPHYAPTAWGEPPSSSRPPRASSSRRSTSASRRPPAGRRAWTEASAAGNPRDSARHCARPSSHATCRPHRARASGSGHTAPAVQLATGYAPAALRLATGYAPKIFRLATRHAGLGARRLDSGHTRRTD